MTTELTILPTGAAELHLQYDEQAEPQSAYLELDLEAGRLYADTDAVIGSGSPDSVRHGFDRRYRIPALTGQAADRLLEEIRPLAQRMLADWEKVWDGNNLVARLGEDALAAEEEIEAIVARYEDEHDVDPADLIAVWDVDSVTNGCEAEEYEITADTPGKRLDEIAAQIRADLADCDSRSVDTVVVVGLDAYLRNLRSNARTDDED
ncbi:hypothetical protein ACFY9C_35345 [Streptomyces filamentosus]|uniref:hypothetical protein n=1 Tax=Streptomyces filamentosus TaxID=67294 RepID=UPI0036ED489E